MADDRRFAPLPGVGRRQHGMSSPDPWQPVVPVPDDAPMGPPRHRYRADPSGSWVYRDSLGRLLGYVLRFDQPDGGKEFLPATYCQNPATGARQWRFKAWLPLRPLYGLDRLAQRPTAPVVVCEGEKAADAAGELLQDHVAVTSPNGAKSVGKADWAVLRGRIVIIWPDNDEEGRTYAGAVAKALRGIAASVKVVSPPLGTREKWDAADALEDGWERAKAVALIASAVADGESTARRASRSPGSREVRPRQSDQLLDCLPELELWHSPDREAFVTAPIGSHVENWRVGSPEFSEWLSRRCFCKHRHRAEQPGSQGRVAGHRGAGEVCRPGASRLPAPR